MRRLLIFFCLCLLTAAPASGQTWADTDNGAKIHLASGAAFPQNAAGLSRLAPQVMNVDGTMVGVSYIGKLGTAPWQAEVMLAPTLADPLTALTAEVRQRSYRLHRAAVGVPRSFVIEGRNGTVHGHRMRIAHITPTGDRSVQEVIVLASGSYLARIVSDYQELRADEAADRLTELMEDIYWPLD